MRIETIKWWFILLVHSINHKSINSSLQFPSETDKLILLQFVFRHGDRTPIKLYRNDPYKPSDFTEGLGELTNRGKKRMFRLGKKFKKRYHSYIDSTKIKNVQARSSSRRRCLESCALVLAGMFPPRTNEVWIDKENESEIDNIASLWQPIAITTVEPTRDRLLFPEAECLEAFMEEEKINNSPEMRIFLDENKDFIKGLTKRTGTNFPSWIEVGYLYNTLIVEQEYFGPNFVKPKWIDQMGNDTMDRLRRFHDLEFSVFHSSKKYLKLRVGELLKQLLSNMQTTLENIDQMNRTENHIYLYSTHDTLLGYLLSVIGSKINQPTYGSGLIIELMENSNNKPYVRVFYFNGTDNYSIKMLQIKGCSQGCQPYQQCDHYCNYKNFIQLFSDYIPVDIALECSRQQNNNQCQ